VFGNRVVMRIFGPKRDEVTAEWKKMHNQELLNLNSSSLRRSSQGGWGGRGIWNAWERREMCARLWWESHNERDHSEDRGVGGMGSEWSWGDWLGLWSGFSWLRIGTGSGLLLTRWWTFRF
jgi:hypothetical protein